MTAITFDHTDPEMRRGRLVIDTSKLDSSDDRWQPWKIDLGGQLTIWLSDEDAIALYEEMRRNWAGYVAERDEAKHDWAEANENVDHIGAWEGDTLSLDHDFREAAEDMADFGYALDDPKHPTYHDRMVD